MKNLCKPVAAAICLTWLVGCAVNPVTGRSELALLDENWEIATGRQNYAPVQQIEGGKYLVDPELTRYVAAVGARLAQYADRRLPYEFTVINASVANAWALPGGKIGVNRGLLVELETEAELAALLGHEIVHAAARHGARNQQRRLLAEIALVTTELVFDDAEQADLILAGAQLGATLITQGYSREDERESDYYGMRYMAAAGYDPRGAVWLQEKLVALNKGKRRNRFQRMFASHPPSPERLRDSHAALSQFAAGGEIKRDRYQRAIAYVKSKQPAYEHADAAVQLAERGAPGAALDRLDAALRIEPNEATFYTMKGDLLRNAGYYQDALAQYNQALERDRGYYRHYLGRGLANFSLNRPREAAHDLRISNSLMPTHKANAALNALGFGR